MKRALLISGDFEGDEAVITVDLAELEFLVFCTGGFTVGGPTLSPSNRLHQGLKRALEDMRIHARADGADV